MTILPNPAPDGTGHTNEGLFVRAQKVLVGGVNSPVRAFRSVGGTPYFVARGKGGHLWDVEGAKYIDLVQSYGAVLLGHAHPNVTAAVQEAVTQGSTYGAPTYREVLLAEAMCERVPGLEMVRMTSSGTEAAMSVVRLARGITGRSRIIKFAGCYHGASDSLLAAGGSGVANLGLPGSDGVPPSAVADTIVAPYNVVPEIGSDVAAVVAEPVAANMGLVAPKPGFLEGLRAACDKAGALLVFDEVITGFRLGSGGATVWSRVRPDLWCFGKVIGGGLPVGAFGGSRDAMASLAPLGPVYQGGTLCGNPLATAAGLAVLNTATDDDYLALRAKASHFATGLADAIRSGGLTAEVPVVETLVGLHLDATAAPIDYDEVKANNAGGTYASFFHEMLSRGVAMAPGAYEALFPGFAHTADDLERACDAAHASALAVVARR